MSVSHPHIQNAQPQMSGCHSVLLAWRDYTVQIDVTRNVFNLSNMGINPYTHLEIRSVNPVKAPLPITETGYKSAFLPESHLEDYESIEDYVRLWLEDAAQSDDWLEQEFNHRQMTLF